MTEESAAVFPFMGTMPEAYDEYMVPLLFQPYADLVAGLVAGRPAALLPTHDVLEVAAGTGVLSRALAVALPAATIFATDIAPPMLEVAERHGSWQNLRYRQADALAVPFPDESIDLVVSQFGIMFFPDRVAALAEARRVLRVGGELLVLAWDSLAANPLVETAFTVIDRFVPGQLEFVSRMPHGYHDPSRFRADAEAAGLRVDTCAVLAAPTRSPSARAVAVALVFGSPVRAILEADLSIDGVAVATAVETAVREQYGDGEVTSQLSAVMLSATRTDA